MKRESFKYRKLMALCAVMALTLVQSAIGFSPARSTIASLAVDEPNLDSEVRTLDKYFDDLVAYQKECGQLNTRPSLLSADVDPLQRKSDDLKRRLSDIQNAIREVVRKLKAANAWNDLDTATAARIKDASQRAEFQQESFKQLLEDSAANLSSHASEISVPLDALRKKVASRTLSPYGDGALRIVPAAYHPPTPMKFYSVACTIAKTKGNLIFRFGGLQGPKSLDDTSCACTPGATTGSGTGTKCTGFYAQ